MEDARTDALIRIANALDRLADRFCPEKAKVEKRPAVLTTATYNREERERKAFREGQKQGSQGAAPSAPRSDG